MNTVVYALIHYDSWYDRYNLEKIFATEAAAKAYLEKMLPANRRDYEIEPYELEGIEDNE